MVKDDWWGANKAEAIAHCGKPNAPTATLAIVAEALTTDREWTGKFELKMIDKAFGFALVVCVNTYIRLQRFQIRSKGSMPTVQ